jgi:hypothetical protein
VGTSERNEQACLKRNASGSLDFAMNELERSLAVHWQEGIRESSDIHGWLSMDDVQNAMRSEHTLHSGVCTVEVRSC